MAATAEWVPRTAAALTLGVAGGCAVCALARPPPPPPQPQPEPEQDLAATSAAPVLASQPLPPHDPWSDESDGDEPPELEPTPSGEKPSCVHDGPFVVGVAVQRDRSRLKEFATHGRRNGWFGTVVLLAPPAGSGLTQELLVLAAQAWLAPDSGAFLKQLCEFLADEAQAYLSVEHSALVSVTPLPPYQEDSAEEEAPVVGRLGLSVDGTHAAAVMKSVPLLEELLQRFVEGQSVALFDQEAAGDKLCSGS